MKGILIFLIIIIVLVIGGFGIYFFGFAESEVDMKATIENAFYEDQFFESCQSRGYVGFNSRDDCENAVRCISTEMTELVKKEDLKDMSNKMKWTDDAEHTMVVYLTEELKMDHNQLDSISKYCLEQNG